MKFTFGHNLHVCVWFNETNETCYTEQNAPHDRPYNGGMHKHRKENFILKRDPVPYLMNYRFTLNVL